MGVNFKLYKEYIDNGSDALILEFNSPYRINIISGDSGEGKSYLVDIIEQAIYGQNEWRLEHNVKEVTVINSLDNKTLENIKHSDGELFIIDEDILQGVNGSKAYNIINKSSNYFLITSRDAIVKIDTNVKALFRLKKTGIKFENQEQFEVLKDTVL